MSAEPLLTTEDVAGLLQVHPKHVYRLLRRGLPGHRMGGEWRFARDEVLRWVERRESAPTPSEGESAPSLVAANGDVAVEVLLGLVNAAAPPLLGFVPADRDAAMALLAAGHVLAAGCHAMGPPSHLAGARLARIHLVTRTIGLAGGSGALADLATLRLAARPPTAGVRGHLDAALCAADLDPAAILARATTYDSHRDALLAVVRGDADVALATQAWAARFGLPFHALTTEAYGLVVRAADLGDPRVVRLCEVAQRATYRSALATVPGYDATGAGDIRYDAA
ncbi:MAG: helix-turn-helix transcriptional regulator [Pseudomonadota bacterium]|nr:helix-turn-helix transcriptional regulator [Pseudomonadota bacterium]